MTSTAADAKELQAVLALAKSMALEAGEVQRARFETPLRVETKSNAADLVTEVDRECEARIINALQRERPRDAVLSEEGGGTAREGADWRWVVDPLDGTSNFAHGYPRFCVSVAAEYRGAPAVGVVYDPLLRELYEAVRGGGARRNGRPIHVSQEGALANAMLATGFGYDRKKSVQENIRQFAYFLSAARAMRRCGSAALDLCFVACGRLDAYWEMRLSPWDVAAGCLMVEEAGGRTSDTRGGNEHRKGRRVLASNGKLHDAMLQALAKFENGEGGEGGN